MSRSQLRRLRICELVLAPAFGGAETLAVDLARSLGAEGHTVDVVALDDSSSTAPFGIDVAARPRYVRGQRLRRLMAVHRLARSGRYDVIHAHSFLPNLYARAGVAVSGRRMPVVVTLLSGVDDFAGRTARIAERLLLPWTTAVVAMGDRLRDEYAGYFPALGDRLVAIPLSAHRAPLPSSYADAPRQFAVVGRIAAQKDLETAIRGFAAFARDRNGHSPTLTIVGPPSEPPYARAMQELADAIAPDVVRFTGASRDPFSMRFDVLVHTALGEAHTPITILEAAARGIPVVCSNVGAMGSAIGWHCATFRAGSADELATALRRVHDHWVDAVRQARMAWESVPRFTETSRQFERLLRAAAEGAVIPGSVGG